MTTWKADVFVNSKVGRISTTVEAATFSGAEEQIYAKHGDVQQIMNLRQVSSESSSGSYGFDGSWSLIFIVFGLWLAITYWPITLAILILWVIYQILK
jgi:hypothetical protein